MVSHRNSSTFGSPSPSGSASGLVMSYAVSKESPRPLRSVSGSLCGWRYGGGRSLRVCTERVAGWLRTPSPSTASTMRVCSPSATWVVSHVVDQAASIPAVLSTLTVRQDPPSTW